MKQSVSQIGFLLHTERFYQQLKLQPNVTIYKILLNRYQYCINISMFFVHGATCSKEHEQALRNTLLNLNK